VLNIILFYNLKNPPVKLSVNIGTLYIKHTKIFPPPPTRKYESKEKVNHERKSLNYHDLALCVYQLILKVEDFCEGFCLGSVNCVSVQHCIACVLFVHNNPKVNPHKTD
jgi:hypothetical protein